MENKITLVGKNIEQLETFMLANNQSKYRAKQVYNWLYLKSVPNYDLMTDLPLSARELLKERTKLCSIFIKDKQVSKDGTIKYLFEHNDGTYAEAVLMRFDNRANLTACVSSQVGCAVNCSFCATGKKGFVRNLSYKEIIEQVLTIQRDTGLKVTNIVFMGQGEPLDNYNNVVKALEIINKNLQIIKQNLKDFIK